MKEENNILGSSIIHVHFYKIAHGSKSAQLCLFLCDVLLYMDKLSFPFLGPFFRYQYVQDKNEITVPRYINMYQIIFCYVFTYKSTIYKCADRGICFIVKFFKESQAWPTGY